jgi:hypothetical protein
LARTHEFGFADDAKRSDPRIVRAVNSFSHEASATT